MQPDAVINLVGNVGAIGFVVWLGHRLTTRTIPDMTQQFIEATQSQRSDFQESLREQRKAHEASMRSVMDKCLATKGGD